ncbi:4'-phosphopantetheinyl transferase superfamily protein [Mucilaginibacter pallidiroseus]|uniref:4'-phosphopantetheinyl transferase superfamily protein n=1 Tax=Mucilaginibacter pallidiroseus TaxID=2599295 RepID=A0A563U3I3_9SPHI|nr:4'-phosphopantetheinyl transferase superfamily protein [Mucilaginibacter pallidiroseus]TWR25883.1 4'-phosphopantetheinyl transferase superfamily protein [Mucilaginibacter pallidiroseus]
MPQNASVAIAHLETVDWQQMPVNGFLLNDPDVHLWRVCISQHINEIVNLKRLLTPDEAQRGSKYLHQADRDRFLVSRGYQRTILSGYIDIKPEDLRFALSHNKKPHIANSGVQNLNYNVSHSGDWILIAVSKHAVGCDIEYIDPKFDFTDILPDNFSQAEGDFIKENESTNRFYKLWTRKEALLKATGQGLGEHLIDTPSLNGISNLNADLLGSGKAWTVKSFSVTKGYAGALAVANIAPSISFYDI